MKSALAELPLATLLSLFKRGEVSLDEAIEALEQKAGFCVEVDTCTTSKLSKKQD